MYVYVLTLVSAGIVCVALYDFIIAAIHNRYSNPWTDQRNAPIRLIVWGGLGFLVVAGWIALWSVLAAAALVVTEALVITGVFWWRHTHHAAPARSAPAKGKK